MSGKEINPFADPNEVNPFAASPSMSAASHQPAEVYNPFAEQIVKPVEQQSTFASPTPTYISSPATLQPTRQDISPPYQASYGPSAGGYGTNADASMRQRQEELERKAAELDMKERELRRQQAERSGIRENNFPPLPKFFCMKPCFYHDINVDIPMEKQRTCRMIFYLWQFYAFTLFFNVISAVAFMATQGEGSTTVFGVSLIYFVAFIPCSFVCWYRPIYKALKSDSSFNYMMFFFVFFCQIILCAVYSLGISTIGTVGWINGAGQVDLGNKAVSAMMFLCAAFWTILAIFMCLLLRKVHTAYRQSGASIEKAQGEFARGVASNKNVQSAASEAVKAGLSK